MLSHFGKLRIFKKNLLNQINGICENARNFHYHRRVQPKDGESTKVTEMNMMQAINRTLDDCMKQNKDTIIFGEDIGFGGVFRCTVDLQDRYGRDRVFNTPISEQAIVGFGIGAAAAGTTVIAEIQFADYIFPAFDQLVNELAKLRYRSGDTYNCGKMVVRAPCGVVGHGGHYHSQTVERYFMSTPGLKIVVPRGPYEARGLLRECVKDNNPILFFEPKILYRHAVDMVPDEHYFIQLEKAELVKKGNNVTIVSWGASVHRVLSAIEVIEQEMGITCEVIDLQTILPWDEETVIDSVKKTHRLAIVHEGSVTGGCGAEISATIQETVFSYLEAPIQRICGLDIPIPVTTECFAIPQIPRIIDDVKQLLKYE